MRRHPFATAYLVLLALSTSARWLMGAFAHQDRVADRWDQGSGSPIIILLDEQVRATGPRLVVDLGLAAHPVVMTRGKIETGVAAARASHLVAFGTAGPDAIAFAADHPDEVRSLTLIDADGIEEFDLLGDHQLNQILRRAEMVAIDGALVLVPHFGLLDILTRDMRIRAERLLGYDRRQIRGELARWDGPAAVLTSGDSRSRLAMAREHHRLLPQSELLPWRADSLVAFIDRVDEGRGTTRAEASAERVAAAARPFDAGGIASAQGSALIVVLCLLALVTLLSEDLACVTAGMLAARGSIPLIPAIIACYLGIILGDQLLYLLGRSAGRALVTRFPIRWILPAERLDQACEWFRTHGMQVVLTSRFLPGTRFPVYVAAGILRGGFVRFALWLMAIGAVWTPALVALSYEATRHGRSTVESLPGATWVWVLGLLIGGTLLLRLLIPLLTAEGRRAAAAAWRRAVETGAKSRSD